MLAAVVRSICWAVLANKLFGIINKYVEIYLLRFCVLNLSLIEIFEIFISFDRYAICILIA